MKTNTAANLSQSNLWRSTAKVLETQRPTRKWADIAASDLLRAARRIEQMEAALRLVLVWGSQCPTTPAEQTEHRRAGWAACDAAKQALAD